MHLPKKKIVLHKANKYEIPNCVLDFDLENRRESELGIARPGQRGTPEATLGSAQQGSSQAQEIHEPQVFDFTSLIWLFLSGRQRLHILEGVGSRDASSRAESHGTGAPGPGQRDRLRRRREHRLPRVLSNDEANDEGKHFVGKYLK